MRLSTPLAQGYRERLADRHERVRFADARALSLMLAALERRSGGAITGASFEVDGGVAYYEVGLVTDIGRTDIRLNAANGAQLAFVPDD